MSSLTSTDKFTTSKSKVPLTRDPTKSLVLHQWTPTPCDDSGSEQSPSKKHDNDEQQEDVVVAIVYHGFGAHANYPTVRYAAELLTCQCQMTVYSADMEGHGESPGERGLLPTVDDLLNDAVSIAKHVVQLQVSSSLEKASSTTNAATKKIQLMLVGSSMGGALCLHTSVHPDVAPHVKGVVLLAPLLSLNVSSIELMALKCLSHVIPDCAVIPSSSTSPEAQYRDVLRRTECTEDPLSYGGKLKVQSALTCVELAERTKSLEFLRSISSDFWLGIGTEDVVVQNETAHTLYDVSSSTKKELKSYKALHGLLCETQPLRDQIEQDIISWVKRKTEYHPMRD